MRTAGGFAKDPLTLSLSPRGESTPVPRSADATTSLFPSGRRRGRGGDFANKQPDLVSYGLQRALREARCLGPKPTEGVHEPGNLRDCGDEGVDVAILHHEGRRDFQDHEIVSADLVQHAMVAEQAHDQDLAENRRVDRGRASNATRSFSVRGALNSMAFKSPSPRTSPNIS